MAVSLTHSVTLTLCCSALPPPPTHTNTHTHTDGSIFGDNVLCKLADGAALFPYKGWSCVSKGRSDLTSRQKYGHRDRQTSHLCQSIFLLHGWMVTVCRLLSFRCVCFCLSVCLHTARLPYVCPHVHVHVQIQIQIQIHTPTFPRPRPRLSTLLCGCCARVCVSILTFWLRVCSRACVCV